MRREGRQHWMVRTYPILPSPFNPRPKTRILNRIDSPTRPTNQSKFTCKCNRARCLECHLHLACKSKDKTKGSNKNKRFDASEHRMVVDGRPGLGLSGISAASGLLSNVADYGYDDYVNEDLICRGLEPAADDNENKGLNPADQDNYGHKGGDMNFYDVGLVLDHIEEGD